MDSLLENLFYIFSIDWPDWPGGYFLLIAKNALMGAALVWNEDGYD
jgi:hypothetical protein